jgi:hypothetical protein
LGLSARQVSKNQGLSLQETRSKSDVTPKGLEAEPRCQLKRPKSSRHVARVDLITVFLLAACTSVSSHLQPTNSLKPAQTHFLPPRLTQAHRSFSHVKHTLRALGNGRPQHATSPRDCRIARLHHPPSHPPESGTHQQTWTTPRPTSWSSSCPPASRHSRTSTKSCSGGTRPWSGSWPRQEIR